jgi:hypothetical protein
MPGDNNSCGAKRGMRISRTRRKVTVKESFAALSGPRKTAIMAAAAVVVAVFLPWVSVFGLSVSGISTGDGKIVLVVAAVALVLLAAASRLVMWFEVSRKLADILSLIAGAICLLVAVADMNDFAAIGLYVTLIASLAWTVSAAMTLFKREQSTEDRSGSESSG